MILDAICLVTTVMLVVIGWRHGGLLTVGRWGAFLGAAALSVPLGAALRADVARWLPKYPELAGPLATLLAWAGLFAVFLLFVSVLVRFVKLAPFAVGADSLLGVVLGLAKGLAITYALACFMVLLERPLRSAFPPVGGQMDASIAIGVAKDVNLVDQVMRDKGLTPPGPAAPGAALRKPAPQPPAPGAAPPPPPSPASR